MIITPTIKKHILNNPTIERNSRMLRRRGWHWIDPEAGELASGAEGRGRLAPIEQIVERVEAVLGDGGLVED